MNFAVLVFPGTWSERDCQYVLAHEMGQRADLVWHRESNLDAYDAVVIPGGFSYGDHLRTGAIARFSPVMEAVQRHADAGKPVIGICNGFQILCESHLLPGALMRNDSLQFRCVPTYLRIENADTMFTRSGRAGAGADGADLARRGQLLRRRGDGCGARSRAARRVPLRDAGRRSRRPKRTRTARSTTSPASSTSAATCWA